MNHYEVVFEIDTEDEDEIREALKLIQNSHTIYEVKVRKDFEDTLDTLNFKISNFRKNNDKLYKDIYDLAKDLGI